MTGDVYAAELPPEMIYDGKPIDALCFEAVSADEWVDISTCAKRTIIPLPDKAEAWTADKIGYYYRYKEDASDAVSYSYYQYVGQWNGAAVVVSYGSGGGTGQFTSLVSIERNARNIRVLQGFGAGDRCNGGIVDAKLSFGTLSYGQNMTPIDFLQIAGDNPHDLQPYDDLEASAASCFGVARFEDEKFVGVTLADAPQPADPATSYKYQECFNRLFRAAREKGKKELSVSELKEFTGEFNAVCAADAQEKLQ
ncbi:MAG: hypothetical protein SFX19_05760 [Alphaproteobacteria bacterium]|nr:hypothetical protein [Alphaproteobacteria bacterium]